jgi:hypothetical protein
MKEKKMKKKTRKAIKRILNGKPIQSLNVGWLATAAVAYFGYRALRDRGIVPEKMEQIVSEVFGIQPGRQKTSTDTQANYEHH